MKRNTLIFVALMIVAISPALAGDDVFDVPNGEFTTLYSGALAPNTLVSCEFSIEEPYYGDEWVPMVSIIFKEAEQPDNEVLYFKLSASRSNRDQDRDWRHELRIQYGDNRETKIVPYSGESEFTSSMHMMLDDEDYVVFFFGDDVEHMSVIDASEFEMTIWKVNVSGVKGSGDCDSKILGTGDDD